MKKYQVIHRNFCGDSRKFIFVEAMTADDAKILALRHIREKGASIDGHIVAVDEEIALPEGRVI
jgi:hypothetical protein